MTFLLAVKLILGTVAAGMWLALAIAAFKQSVGQGLLTVVLPGYVLYFMFIRSRWGPVLRFAFVLAIAGNRLAA